MQHVLGEIDYLCPTWHQSLRLSRECSNGNWHDIDDTDFSEAVVGDGVQ